MIILIGNGFFNFIFFLLFKPEQCALTRFNKVLFLNVLMHLF